MMTLLYGFTLIHPRNQSNAAKGHLKRIGCLELLSTPVRDRPLATLNRYTTEVNSQCPLKPQPGIYLAHDSGESSGCRDTGSDMIRLRVLMIVL